MPVYYNSSTRKSSGFSIDDIIKSETLRKPSHPSTIVIPAMTCFPPTPALYQLQRESIFHFFRHASPYPHPGAAVAAAYLLNSYRKPKRNRTAFTPTQLLKLENEFEKNHYIVGQERKDLAKHLNLPESKVKVWYQNRRTKHKRLNHEDSQSSSNEVEQANESDFLIKIDEDDDSWSADDAHQQ